MLINTVGYFGIICCWNQKLKFLLVTTIQLWISKIMSVHLEYLYVYVQTYAQCMDCKVLLTLQSGVMLLWSFHTGPAQPSAQCQLFCSWQLFLVFPHTHPCSHFVRCAFSRFVEGNHLIVSSILVAILFLWQNKQLKGRRMYLGMQSEKRYSSSWREKLGRRTSRHADVQLSLWDTVAQK